MFNILLPMPLEGVCSLQKFIIFTEITFDKMWSHSFTIDTAIDTFMFKKKADGKLITLNNVQQKKNVMKIARSSISVVHGVVMI